MSYSTFADTPMSQGEIPSIKDIGKAPDYDRRDRSYEHLSEINPKSNCSDSLSASYISLRQANKPELRNLKSERFLVRMSRSETNSPRVDYQGSNSFASSVKNKLSFNGNLWTGPELEQKPQLKHSNSSKSIEELENQWEQIKQTHNFSERSSLSPHRKYLMSQNSCNGDQSPISLRMRRNMDAQEYILKKKQLQDKNMMPNLLNKVVPQAKINLIQMANNSIPAATTDSNNQRSRNNMTHSKSLDQHRPGHSPGNDSDRGHKKNPLKAIYDKYKNIHKKNKVVEINMGTLPQAPSVNSTPNSTLNKQQPASASFFNGPSNRSSIDKYNQQSERSMSTDGWNQQPSPSHSFRLEKQSSTPSHDRSNRNFTLPENKEQAGILTTKNNVSSKEFFEQLRKISQAQQNGNQQNQQQNQQNNTPNQLQFSSQQQQQQHQRAAQQYLQTNQVQSENINISEMLESVRQNVDKLQLKKTRTSKSQSEEKTKIGAQRHRMLYYEPKATAKQEEAESLFNIPNSTEVKKRKPVSPMTKNHSKTQRISNNATINLSTQQQDFRKESQSPLRAYAENISSRIKIKLMESSEKSHQDYSMDIDEHDPVTKALKYQNLSVHKPLQFTTKGKAFTPQSKYFDENSHPKELIKENKTKSKSSEKSGSHSSHHHGISNSSINLKMKEKSFENGTSSYTHHTQISTDTSILGNQTPNQLNRTNNKLDSSRSSSYRKELTSLEAARFNHKNSGSQTTTAKESNSSSFAGCIDDITQTKHTDPGITRAKNKSQTQKELMSKYLPNKKDDDTHSGTLTVGAKIPFVKSNSHVLNNDSNIHAKRHPKEIKVNLVNAKMRRQINGTAH